MFDRVLNLPLGVCSDTWTTEENFIEHFYLHMEQKRFTFLIRTSDDGDDDDELLCGVVNRQKAFSLISSWDHCQRSSQSRISNTPRAGFEPAQNLSSELVE